jgi:hypothetical protein
MLLAQWLADGMDVHLLLFMEHRWDIDFSSPSEKLFKFFTIFM